MSRYPMTTPAILWGPNFENVLSMGWPLDNVVTGRKPRAGSVFDQGMSGVEDAWVTGFDYELTADFRWLDYSALSGAISQSGWDGALGMQAFLDWARQKNTFRFVPDKTIPLFFVDGCYLEDPMDTHGALEPDGTRAITLTLRNPTTSFGLAFRGLMLDYAPGVDVSASGLNGVFTRGSVGTRDGVDGLVTTDAINVLRDRHYISAVRNTLFELTRTNVALWCRDMTNAAWTKVTMTPLLDQVGTDGVANSASSLLATGANATCIQAIVLGSSARFQTAYVKRITGAGTIQMTMDNGATWTTITITTAWARFSIPTQTLANPSVGFRIVTSGDKIAVDFVQNENGTYATRPILTTTAAVTRSIDSPLTFAVPLGKQAMWMYIKLLDYIQLGGIPASTTVAMQMGWPDGERWTIEGLASYSSFRTGPNGNVTKTLAIGTLGNPLELLLLVFPDGSIQLIESLNGAADVASTQSGPVAFAPSVPGGIIQLGGASPNMGQINVLAAKAGVTPGVNSIALARAA